MSTTVDARGLSCPQPVLDTLTAIQTTRDNTITVLVDTEASKENVTRAVQGKGWRVSNLEENDGEYSLTLTKS
ncbi:sulfurtransferase TusA family protein [Desulfoplanes formicivorans]|uniref:Preprotein translocase subunit TatB n=1 Tax=Desulfoplanes formicivorans TaxID=1592317 RepID=A0A194AEZ2_9BACT|nr:sulfurtransferase TusA family protein [Desulfoplanes formicivorans]GAU07661.1 preprotein translocase subunit TatB [Desulfoplanes formicivorans]